MTERWRRSVLYLACAWNVLGALSALASPGRHFAQLYNTALSLDDPLQEFFFRSTWVNVIAWGIAYLLAARSAATREAVLLAGGAGKIAYSGLCIALFFSGAGRGMLLAAGVVDLVFAGLFALVLWSGRLPADRPAA